MKLLIFYFRITNVDICNFIKIIPCIWVWMKYNLVFSVVIIALGRLRFLITAWFNPYSIMQRIHYCPRLQGRARLRSTIAELSSLLTPRTSQGLILKPRAAIVSSKAATKIHRTLETIHECNSGCPSHKFMKHTSLHQIVHLHDQDAPRTDCLQYSREKILSKFEARWPYWNSNGSSQDDSGCTISQFCLTDFVSQKMNLIGLSCPLN